jgi:hypothetical protein
METTQRILLHSYLFLKLPKLPCCFYIFCIFSFYKIREQEGGTGSTKRWWGGGWYQGQRDSGGEKDRRMNMVQIMYTHVSKCKNDTCWNCSRNWGRGHEKE